MKRNGILGVLAVTSGLILAAWAAPAFAAGSPNYATSTEHWTQLSYTGYVQIQPSYRDPRGGPGHALYGWFQYSIPNEKIGPVVQTKKGSGPTDSRIYSATGTFTDSLNPDAAQTKFDHDFYWVPAGSPWPFSLDV